MRTDNRLIGAFLATCILVLCIHVANGDRDGRTNYGCEKPSVFPRPRNDPRYTRYDRPIATSTGLAVCGKDQCTELSYGYIESRFGAIFQTDHQANQITVQMCKDSGGTLSPARQHGGGTSHSHDDEDSEERGSESRVTCNDGDSCCPTSTFAAVKWTVENIHGKSRIVIHLNLMRPPKYQYISYGLCSYGGKCDGRCLQEQRVQSVLVYDPSQPIPWFPYTYDMVYVPSYCSCKNIGDREEGGSESRVTCDDGDSCCPTSTSATVKWTVKNIHGEWRYVIHFNGLTPPKYQYIHQGICSSGGECDGMCLQEVRVQSVLVWDPRPPIPWFPFTFDMVYVPSYCSCKNIGGSG